MKINPVGVNLSMHIDFNEKLKKEDPKCKVGDHVWISKSNDIFAKGNFSKLVLRFFLRFKKIKSSVLLLVILAEKKLL